MSFESKVAVIVPVYNVEKYLPRCIESCIQQTLYDIEIICVNDGSTDRSREILEDYEKLDNRVKVIDKRNGGLSSARNVGVLNANSTWIMFLDSDDYFENNACERVWVESQEDKTDIIVFGTNIFPVYPEIPNWYKSVLYTKNKRYYDFEPKVLFSTAGSKPFVWRQAFSRALLNETKVLFNENARYGEDLLFQFEIFPFAKKFSFISDRLYNYHLARKDSLMDIANSDMDYKIQEHLKMVEIITSYWQTHGLIGKYGINYLSWLLDFMVPDLYRFKLNNRNKYADDLRNIIKKYNLDIYKKELKKDLMEQYNRLSKLK